MRARDLKTQNEPPSICIVGHAGCGKTGLSSQVGNGSYCFDFDNGMRTALTLEDAFTSYRQSTEFDIYVDSNLSNPQAFVKAKNTLRELQKNPPRAVVLDSLTGLAFACRYHVMKTAGKPLGQPEIQHWGIMIREIEQFLYTIRSMKCLSIITAHDAYQEDEKGKLHAYINSITKSHGRNGVAWLFDEVLYMKTRAKGAGKFEYVVCTQGSDIPVRTRSSIFEPFDITTCGLTGLLAKVGYSFEPKEYKENEQKSIPK